MNNDAGWCGSGGPWITPELSMQKVVWTETDVDGPQPLRGRAAAAEGGGRITIATSPCWPFPRRRATRAFEELGGKAAYAPAARRTPGAIGLRLPPERAVAARPDRGPDGADGQRRPAGLGRAGGQVDGPAPRPHDHRQGQSSRAGGGPRAGVRQAQQGGGRGDFDGLMGKLIADAKPLGGQDARLDAHRQLGGRLAELDAAVARGVPAAARLRSAAVPAGDGRARGRTAWKSPSGSCGTCGRPSPTCCSRTTPAISASWRTGTDLRLSIEAYDGVPVRRHGLRRPGRRADGASSGRGERHSAPPTVARRWPRRRTSTASASSAPRRSPRPTPRSGRVTRPPSRTWATGRSARASTASCSTATPCSRGRTDCAPGHVDGAVGPALRADADLVGAVARRGTSTWPAASSCCSRACSWPTSAYLAAGRRAAGVSRPPCRTAPAARPSGRLQLRRLPAGGRAHAHDGQGRPARAARRHELPPAGAAAGGDDDAALAAQDQGAGRRRARRSSARRPSNRRALRTIRSAMPR